MFRKNFIIVFFLVSIVLCSLSVAHAAVVGLNFFGTYDTNGREIFGEIGDAIPFSYFLYYDTDAVGALIYDIASGTELDGELTAHRFVGYSEVGITSVLLEFGTGTWTIDRLETELDIATGYSAALWFDTDISIETPTRTWISFFGNGGFLRIGGPGVPNGTIYLDTISSVFDFNVESSATSSNLTIAAIPEPSTYILLALGVLGFGRYVIRRRRG